MVVDWFLVVAWVLVEWLLVVVWLGGCLWLPGQVVCAAAWTVFVLRKFVGEPCWVVV